MNYRHIHALDKVYPLELELGTVEVQVLELQLDKVPVVEQVLLQDMAADVVLNKKELK